jgi:prepilin-type N-terminal cleavage/methylation domain-containing protein
MTKTLTKGFTLIELLVVIAIIGILAAVVLVAINPAERIAEANDSKAKSNLGQVATAMESCYTANGGKYDSCLTTSVLNTGGYLKQNLTDVSINPASGTPTAPVAYVEVTAKSNGGGCTTAGQHAYFKYDTSTGATTKIACTATAPTGS